VRTRLRRVVREGVRPRRVKVSIVIATYNSPAEGLERVMRSIGRQSMHPREIEIVFVDDGSTDDTPQRLAAIARSRPNVVVRAIPNSGWASRPRNVGVRMARGEYVLFMDHDDELLPTGLQRAYDFGRQHAADVVNAKEVRTTGWSWGWGAFAQDIGHATFVDPNPLIPMTPHKLYRRQFLLEHNLTFPEGARVLWEDIYFNTRVFASGARVAVLSRYPLYHWVQGAQNTSKTFGRDVDELWTNLGAVMDDIAAELADRPGRTELLHYQAQHRVLGFLGPRSLNRSPEQYAVAYRHARRLVADYAPVELDERLTSVDRCRVELVRLDRPDLQRLLAQCDRGVTAVPTIDGIRWEGPELVMTVTATLLDEAGAPLRLRRDGDRWRRNLPPELLAVLSDQAVDVTDDLERASFAASVKGRSTRSTWRIESTGTVACVEDGEGYGTVTARLTARFDPTRFAAEHDLTDPVWDFAARLDAFGYGIHRGLRGGAATVALLSGVPAIGYVNKDELYSLDVAAQVRTVTGSAGIAPQDVTVAARTVGAGVQVEFRAALPSVHCAGSTDLAGEVLLGPDRRVPARLTGGADGATLSFRATVPAGDHPLRSRFLGRTGNTGLVLSVAGGEARVVPAAPAVGAG
jgi:hypothetical protein